MSNKDTDVARAYHEATKLHYIRLEHKPPPYKSYPNSSPTPLPVDFQSPTASALEAVGAITHQTTNAPDITSLAQLLYYSAGLIRVSRLPTAGEIHYRAASSAGALFPTEVYVACEDLEGLKAGLYHFSPNEFAFNSLRSGDFRAELSAAADDPEIAGAPATLILTSVFWRSAWKYRGRSYRYCMWDCGTIVANILAVAAAQGTPARLVAGFVDYRVNHLLGIDGDLEAAMCLVPLGPGRSTEIAVREPPPIPQVGLGPYSFKVDHPEIGSLHRASGLEGVEDVHGWRTAGDWSPPPNLGPVHLLKRESGVEAGAASLGDSISGRGSTRRFSRQEISSTQLAAVLGVSTTPVPADFLGEGGGSLLDKYVIVNAVEGVKSGSYYYRSGTGEMELLGEGSFREEAGHLCFEQALGADAATVVYFLADLERLLERYGNRGYRAAQLEAGILAGRMYLCCHAVGLGACGTTFFDDEVAAFFHPHSNGKTAIFLVAMGISHERNRVKPFRSRVAVVLDALARGGSAESRVIRPEVG